jgi:predicted enzyme related to lactoylglutathione lyase
MADPTNPVNWFEIPVIDMPRATRFYEGVFTVTLQPMEMGPSLMAMFPMAQGAANASGSLIKTDGYVPSHAGTVVYFHTADIEGTLGRVVAHGGKTLIPKMSIGQFGFIAHFEDTEGNRVALHSMS